MSGVGRKRLGPSEQAGSSGRHLGDQTEEKESRSNTWKIIGSEVFKLMKDINPDSKALSIRRILRRERSPLPTRVTTKRLQTKDANWRRLVGGEVTPSSQVALWGWGRRPPQGLREIGSVSSEVTLQTRNSCKQEFSDEQEMSAVGVQTCACAQEAS